MKNIQDIFIVKVELISNDVETVHWKIFQIIALSERGKNQVSFERIHLDILEVPNRNYACTIRVNKS